MDSLPYIILLLVSFLSSLPSFFLSLLFSFLLSFTSSLPISLHVTCTNQRWIPRSSTWQVARKSPTEDMARLVTGASTKKQSNNLTTNLQSTVIQARRDWSNTRKALVVQFVWMCCPTTVIFYLLEAVWALDINGEKEPLPFVVRYYKIHGNIKELGH